MSSDYVLRINSDTTVNGLYDTYIIDATNNNVTLTLSDITGLDGVKIRIARTDLSSNTVTIQPQVGQTIGGQTNAVMYPKSIALLNSYQLDWSGGVIDTIKRVAILQEQQTTGTNGGNFNSGSWIIRTLNTSSGNLSVSLSSNTFTLPLGFYKIEVFAPAFNVGSHQSRLYNVTTSTAVAYGSSESSNSSNTTNSKVFYYVFLSSTNTFRVEHQCSVTQLLTGLGLATGFTGNTEVYTTVTIKRL